MSPDTPSPNEFGNSPETPGRPKVIRLLMVDGLGLLTKEFKNDLDVQDDIEIVRIVDTAAGALERADHLRPAVVLMDVLVIGGIGIAAAGLVHDRYPDAAMVLLYGERPGNRLLADVAGVAAFLPIACSPAAVIDVVRQAALASNHAPNPDFRHESGSKTAAGAAGDFSATPRLLSAREEQLLQLISLGLTSTTIASELGLRTSTVRTYTQRLLEKLDAHSRVEAVGKAIRLGLIKPW